MYCFFVSFNGFFLVWFVRGFVVSVCRFLSCGIYVNIEMYSPCLVSCVMVIVLSVYTFSVCRCLATVIVFAVWYVVLLSVFSSLLSVF